MFPGLSRIVKCVFVLSHGNSDVERGFSENSYIVTEDRAQLSELSVSSLRYCKDIVKHYGGLLKVPITKQLLRAVGGAHENYVRRLEEQKAKELQEEERRKEAEESQKHQVAQEKEKIKERAASLRHKDKELDEQEKTASKDVMVGQQLLKEANEKLQKAVKDGDMIGINIAYEMLTAAQKKSESAQATMEKIRKGKKRQAEKKLSLIEKLSESSPSSEKKKKKK
jgi:hypothetical protein